MPKLGEIIRFMIWIFMKIFGKRKYKGNDVVNRAYGIDENKIREDSQKVMGRAVAEVNKWLDELKKKQDKEIERLIKEIAKAKEKGEKFDPHMFYCC